MFEFIRAAIGLVFGNDELPAESLMMSIPLYAGRLVDAWNTECCRGGRLVEQSA
ncbi:MAG: hypothetical protein ABSF98_25175 [Bryobacteraceae bacterium]